LGKIHPSDGTSGLLLAHKPANAANPGRWGEEKRATPGTPSWRRGARGQESVWERVKRARKDDTHGPGITPSFFPTEGMGDARRRIKFRARSRKSGWYSRDEEEDMSSARGCGWKLQRIGEWNIHGKSQIRAVSR